MTKREIFGLLIILLAIVVMLSSIIDPVLTQRAELNAAASATQAMHEYYQTQGAQEFHLQLTAVAATATAQP